MGSWGLSTRPLTRESGETVGVLELGWPTTQPALTGVTYVAETGDLRVDLVNETTLLYCSNDGVLCRVELGECGTAWRLSMLPGVVADAEAWMAEACARLGLGLPVGVDVVERLFP